jgi:hypothetical protein
MAPDRQCLAAYTWHMTCKEFKQEAPAAVLEISSHAAWKDSVFQENVGKAASVVILLTCSIKNI